MARVVGHRIITSEPNSSSDNSRTKTDSNYIYPYQTTHCIFCASECLAKFIVVDGKVLEVKCEGEQSLTSNKDDAVLQRQLKSLFIVRNILDVKNKICHKLLKQYNGQLNPELWVNMCPKCEQLVNIYRDIIEEIRILERKANVVKSNLKNAIWNSKRRASYTLEKNCNRIWKEIRHEALIGFEHSEETFEILTEPIGKEGLHDDEAVQNMITLIFIIWLLQGDEVFYWFETNNRQSSCGTITTSTIEQIEDDPKIEIDAHTFQVSILPEEELKSVPIQNQDSFIKNNENRSELGSVKFLPKNLKRKLSRLKEEHLLMRNSKTTKKTSKSLKMKTPRRTSFAGIGMDVLKQKLPIVPCSVRIKPCKIPVKSCTIPIKPCAPPILPNETPIISSTPPTNTLDNTEVHAGVSAAGHYWKKVGIEVSRTNDAIVISRTANPMETQHFTVAYPSSVQRISSSSKTSTRRLKEYKCTKCPAKFYNAEGGKQHRILHLQRVPSVCCSYCGVFVHCTRIDVHKMMECSKRNITPPNIFSGRVH